MASWSQHRGTGLESSKCPVHGSLVVRDVRKRWVWRCFDCLTEAAYGIARFWNGSR